jgi:hypothetical protein
MAPASYLFLDLSTHLLSQLRSTSVTRNLGVHRRQFLFALCDTLRALPAGHPLHHTMRATMRVSGELSGFPILTMRNLLVDCWSTGIRVDAHQCSPRRCTHADCIDRMIAKSEAYLSGVLGSLCSCSVIDCIPSSIGRLSSCSCKPLAHKTFLSQLHSFLHSRARSQ